MRLSRSVRPLFPLVLLSLISQPSRASDDAEVDARLRLFATDPVAAMNAHLPKRDEHGAIVTDSLFDAADIANGDYVVKRDAVRQSVIGDEEFFAPIGANDQARYLVDPGVTFLDTLPAMETLRSAKLTSSPWSDDYWAYYKGTAGARYADPSFPRVSDFMQNYNYTQGKPAQSIYQTGDATAIDKLSPAEKYDLLVGDANYSFTNKMWAYGLGYYQSQGQVEPWMGICHGWAPAAIMVDRPAKAFKVTAADGHTQLTFYPADVKALATTLWANGRTSSRFIGGRCYDKKPATDAIGRVTSPQCFDSNPGSWHMAVVNQIGQAKRSFILDASYDYEVWNQPMVGYSYSYFNPQTLYRVSTLQQATVPIGQFTSDTLKTYRSPDTKSVVGIVMDVSYTVETTPTQKLTNAASDDSVRTVTYLYDLELDQNGKIIGGEWYNNTHPDFLWVPVKSSRATSVGDDAAQGDWDGTGVVPAAWRTAAVPAAKSGQPLAKIVERLVKLANAHEE